MRQEEETYQVIEKTQVNVTFVNALVSQSSLCDCPSGLATQQPAVPQKKGENI